MSKRLRMNGKRVIALRTCEQMQAILIAYGETQLKAVTDDFNLTSSGTGRLVKPPYKLVLKVGSDRARVYLQTNNIIAKRHEKKNSSLLRIVAAKLVE